MVYNVAWHYLFLCCVFHRDVYFADGTSVSYVPVASECGVDYKHAVVLVHSVKRNRDSSVDIATGFRLDYRGLIPVMGKKLVFTPKPQDRLWSSSSFLSSGKWWIFS
jgi:hypothetical protein